MGPVEGLSCPWGRGGFQEGPRWTFPEQQLALQISCLFSFVPSDSLAEHSFCLIPTSPSPSCQYSPVDTGYSLGGSAGAGFWEVLARGFCHRDRSPPRWQLYDLRESWQRSSSCCRTSSGPGSGIKAASGPPGALGGGRIIIQYGGGGRSSLSKSCRISFFIISQFLCH